MILIPIHLPLFPNLLNKLKAEYTIEEVLKNVFLFSFNLTFPNHEFLWAVLTEGIFTHPDQRSPLLRYN